MSDRMSLSKRMRDTPPSTTVPTPQFIQTLNEEYWSKWAPYKRLESQNDEIRRLHLNPGSFEDDLSCTLSIVSLRDNPRYEALSYTWGLANLSERPLYVEGVPFPITSNLDTALRHLRYEKEVRILWVDAICINQQHMGERGSQVSKMDLVYSKALRTVIYLGDADEESEAALDLLFMFAKDQHFPELPIWKDEAHSELDLEKLRAMRGLWKHPWWNRVWVIQEVALAKKVELVCGDYKLQWDEIVLPATMSALKHMGSCCKDLLTPSDVRETNKIFANYHHVIENQNTDRINIQRGKVPNLLLLLKTYREREATDPRDKVYGLLGMASNVAEVGIVPDYSLSWQEVYKRTVISMVKSYQDPDILSRESLGLSLENEKVGLPSWAPNWSASQYMNGDTRIHYWHSRELPHFQAGMGIPFLVVRIPQTDFLCLNGIFLDEIAEMGELAFAGIGEEPGDEVEKVAQESTKRLMQEWEGRIADRMRNEPAYVGGGTWQDAYWKTVAADLIAFIHNEKRCKGIDNQPGYTVEQIAQWFFVLLRYALDVSSSLEWPEVNYAHGRTVHQSWDAAKRLHHMHTALANRKFCITKSGYFGTVPKETQLGDALHIFCAASTPLVLRKGMVEVRGKTKVAYRIVGDAYIHGVMEGQASRGGTRPLTKYLLY